MPVGPCYRRRVVCLSRRKQHPRPPCHFHDEVVRHVPFELSRIAQREHTFVCLITGRRKYGVRLMRGRPQILFEGRYYFFQQRRLCRYYLKKYGCGTQIYNVYHQRQAFICNTDNDKCLLQDLHVKGVTAIAK